MGTIGVFGTSSSSTRIASKQATRPATLARRPPRRVPRKIGWALGLLLILAASLAVKEPEVLLPIGPDQGTYSYVAERILEGRLPYVDAWDNKPPGTYYLHALVLAALPAGERWSGTCIQGTSQPCGYVALQIADILWTTATGLSLLAVARTLGFTPLAVLSSTLLFMVFANVSQLSKEGSTPEKQLLLPMVLSYLCVLRAERGGNARWMAASGALAALALLLKPTAISIPLALAVYWMWRRPARLSRRSVVAFGLGFVAPIALVAVYFARQEALQAMWAAAFEYNLAQASTSPLQIPRGLLAGAWHVFSGSSALLWLLGLAGASMAIRDKKLSLLMCWAVADAASLGLGGAKFAQVYFVQLVPSLALLGGAAVASFWYAAPRQPAVRAYMSLMAATILLLSSQFQASVTLRAWNERTPGRSSTPTEHLLGARFAAIERGGQAEPVFIWGDNSQIYLHANARAPGRFFHSFPLSRQYAERGFRERRQELLRTWEASPPAIIALDPATVRGDPDGSLGLNPNSFPELQAVLTTRYRLVDDGIAGWQVFRRIGLGSD